MTPILRSLQSIAFNFITLLFLMALYSLQANGQVTNPGVPGGRFYKKVILVLDNSSRKPVPLFPFIIAKNGMAIFPARSNDSGYATVLFHINNYYTKVDMLTRKDTSLPRHRGDRYVPVKKAIVFSTRKEIADTTIVLLRRTAEYQGRHAN